jgi:adenine-specific DNA methylase
VCHRNGWLVVDSEKGDPYQFHYSDDFSWHVEIFRWATMVQCPVCGLMVEDDELPAAGLPTELASRDEEIDDPYANWEPDEDFIRGR